MGIFVFLKRLAKRGIIAPSVSAYGFSMHQMMATWFQVHWCSYSCFWNTSQCYEPWNRNILLSHHWILDCTCLCQALEPVFNKLLAPASHTNPNVSKWLRSSLSSIVVLIVFSRTAVKRHPTMLSNFDIQSYILSEPANLVYWHTRFAFLAMFVVFSPSRVSVSPAPKWNNYWNLHEININDLTYRYIDMRVKLVWEKEFQIRLHDLNIQQIDKIAKNSICKSIEFNQFS